MDDLRIVDAGELSLEQLTENVKFPTGGRGNLAVKFSVLAEAVKSSLRLADETFVESKVSPVRQSLNNHINNTNNPHSVNKAQVGLGNVDNTSDINKPVSNATALAITNATKDKVDKSDVYTQTEIDSKLNQKADKSTTYTKTEVDNRLNLKADKATTYTKNETNALLGEKADKSKTYTKTEVDELLQGIDAPVTSVNGKTGDIQLTRDDLNFPSDQDLANQQKEDRFVITKSGRTQREKNNDVVNIQDFATIQEFNSALLNGSVGVMDNINRVPSSAHNTYSRSTNLVARDSSKIKILQGSDSQPTKVNAESPPIWVQRVIDHNSYSQFAHIVGGGLVEVVAKGSRQQTPNKGTWLGFYGNAVANSVNVGTEAAPKGDTDGNVIGIAGFAAADHLFGSARIICALWGYATSPLLTDTEYNNSTDSWQTVGLEVNVSQRHKDAGYQQYLGGTKGGTAGMYLVNYQELNETRKSWQFGLVLHGTQLTGDNANTNPDTWSGFHVGIQLDKIKDVGINFQVNAKRSQTIGIKFPSTQQGSLGYKTAISLGDNKINFGQYTGSDVQPYDVWNIGDQMLIRSADGTFNRRFMIGDSYVAATTFTQTHYINFKWANGTTFRIPAQMVTS